VSPEFNAYNTIFENTFLTVHEKDYRSQSFGMGFAAALSMLRFGPVVVGEDSSE
jgi:hypothetical protein